MDRSDEVLSIVANKLQNQGKYAAFGQHVAQELEELPSEMAIFCKRVISEAVFQAQIGILNQTSRIVTDSTKERPIFRYDRQGSSLPFETVQMSRVDATTQESGHSEENFSQYSYQNL